MIREQKRKFSSARQKTTSKRNAFAGRRGDQRRDHRFPRSAGSREEAQGCARVSGDRIRVHARLTSSGRSTARPPLHWSMTSENGQSPSFLPAASSSELNRCHWGDKSAKKFVPRLVPNFSYLSRTPCVTRRGRVLLSRPQGTVHGAPQREARTRNVTSTRRTSSGATARHNRDHPDGSIRRPLLECKDWNKEVGMGTPHPSWETEVF